MNIRQITAIAAITLLACGALAGQEHHTKMEIKVVSDDGDGETRLVLDSDELGFSLHDMQVGENQSIVDREGRPVLITRTAEGFEFEVDGKTIQMPNIEDGHAMRKHPGGPTHAMATRDDVMIISGKEIDEATKQIIREALAAAGHDSVHFADGHGPESHEVNVITKVVEVSD
jgi:hypothetical protein